MTYFHRIEGFYRAATAGGYARAARDCPYPITAPAIHQQVRKLEADLGVRLLERVGKDAVRPTSQGRALLEFATPFYRDWPTIERAIASGNHTGVLRIEAATMELQHVVPSWIASLRKKSPHLRISLEEVSVGQPTRILQGDVDLVVDHMPLVPEGVSAAHIAKYNSFLVAPRSIVVAQSKVATWKRALADLPFIGFPTQLPHHAIQRIGLDRLGLHYSSALTASSVDAIVALISQGVGFSLLPWPDARGPKMPGVSVRRLTGPNTEFPIVVAYRKRSTPDPWVEAALRALPSLSKS